MSRASIFLFLSHGIVFLAINVFLLDLFRGPYAFLVWLTLPILVAVICHSMYLFLNAHIADLLAIVMGGRRPSTK